MSKEEKKVEPRETPKADEALFKMVQKRRASKGSLWKQRSQRHRMNET